MEAKTKIRKIITPPDPQLLARVAGIEAQPLWGKIPGSEFYTVLLKELDSGKCKLEDKDGVVVRILQAANIAVFYNHPDGRKLELYEAYEEFTDGTPLRVRGLSEVVKKMRTFEDPIDGARRGLREELKIHLDRKQASMRFIPGEIDVLQGPSESYPGLPYQTTRNHFAFYLNESEFNENGYAYHNSKEKRKTVFRWREVGQSIPIDHNIVVQMLQGRMLTENLPSGSTTTIVDIPTASVSRELEFRFDEFGGFELVFKFLHAKLINAQTGHITLGNDTDSKVEINTQGSDISINVSTKRENSIQSSRRK